MSRIVFPTQNLPGNVNVWKLLNDNFSKKFLCVTFEVSEAPLTQYKSQRDRFICYSRKLQKEKTNINVRASSSGTFSSSMLHHVAITVRTILFRGVSLFPSTFSEIDHLGLHENCFLVSGHFFLHSGKTQKFIGQCLCQSFMKIPSQFQRSIKFKCASSQKYKFVIANLSLEFW